MWQKMTTAVPVLTDAVDHSQPPLQQLIMQSDENTCAWGAQADASPEAELDGTLIPPAVGAAGSGAGNAEDEDDAQVGSKAGSTCLTATDAADGSVWTGADSWLEKSCRAELAAAERLLPCMTLPQGAAAASEPQLVEPSPRGPPAPVTWGHRSELKPAKLGMRAALPGKRVNARCTGI
jgi:hypothetical protein